MLCPSVGKGKYLRAHHSVDLGFSSFCKISHSFLKIFTLKSLACNIHYFFVFFLFFVARKQIRFMFKLIFQFGLHFIFKFEFSYCRALHIVLYFYSHGFLQIRSCHLFFVVPINMTRHNKRVLSVQTIFLNVTFRT